MAFTATSQTLAPSAFARGRNVYLTSQHFTMMLAVAGIVHLGALLVYSLMPTDDVQEVPVRTLNLKLGGGGNWVPDSAPTQAPPLEAVEVAPRDIKAVSNKAVEPPPQVTISDLANAKPMLPKMEEKKPEEKTQPQKRVSVSEQLDRQRPAQNPVAPPKAKEEPKATMSIADAAKAWQSDVALPAAPERPQDPPKALPAIAAQPTQYVRPSVNTIAAVPMEAPQSSGSADGKARAQEIQARYTQQISLWIDRHKIYPDAAREKGQKGQVLVRIRVDRQGNIKFSAIETPTGYDLIDQAALQMIQRANPLPAPPADYPGGNMIEFLIPTRFGM